MTSKRLFAASIIAVASLITIAPVRAQQASGSAQIGGTEASADINASEQSQSSIEAKDYSSHSSKGSSNQKVSKTNRASSLVGMDVKNQQNESLGKVEDVVLDFDTGKISYVVLSVGGFLGIGDKNIAVPASAFTPSSDKNHLILNADKERLKEAPGFAKNNWPDAKNPSWGATARFWGAPNTSTAATYSSDQYRSDQTTDQSYRGSNRYNPSDTGNYSDSSDRYGSGSNRYDSAGRTGQYGGSNRYDSSDTDRYNSDTTGRYDSTGRYGTSRYESSGRYNMDSTGRSDTTGRYDSGRYDTTGRYNQGSSSGSSMTDRYGMSSDRNNDRFSQGSSRYDRNQDYSTDRFNDSTSNSGRYSTDQGYSSGRMNTDSNNTYDRGVDRDYSSRSLNDYDTANRDMDNDYDFHNRQNSYSAGRTTRNDQDYGRELNNDYWRDRNSSVYRETNPDRTRIESEYRTYSIEPNRYGTETYLQTRPYESDRYTTDRSSGYHYGQRVGRDMFRGQITSVDPEARTVTVENNSDVRTFTLARKPTIQLKNNRNAQMVDLKVGYTVRVGFHQNSDGTLVADSLIRTDATQK